MVEFHPAYHALMRRSMANGLHSSIWENGAAETGRRHQVRAARFYLTARARDRASLPDHHDQRLAGGADGQPEAVSRMGAARHHAQIRPEPEAAGRKDRADARHGHDREAGRHRRSRQHDQGRARRQRLLPPDRPQMVHVGADVGRLPGAGAGRRGAVLLPGAAHPRRRHRQRLPLPAAEGQARQPLQRLVGGRVRQRHRRDGRRARRRRQDDHGHGDADPARLRRRLVRPDAGRAGRGRPPRAPSRRCSARSSSTSR